MRSRRFTSKISNYFRRKLCFQDKKLKRMKNNKHHKMFQSKVRRSETERKKIKTQIHQLKINKRRMNRNKNLRKNQKTSIQRRPMNKRKKSRASNLSRTLKRIKMQTKTKRNNNQNLPKNNHKAKNHPMMMFSCN